MSKYHVSDAVDRVLGTQREFVVNGKQCVLHQIQGGGCFVMPQSNFIVCVEGPDDEGGWYSACVMSGMLENGSFNNIDGDLFERHIYRAQGSVFEGVLFLNIDFFSENWVKGQWNEASAKFSLDFV